MSVRSRECRGEEIDGVQQFMILIEDWKIQLRIEELKNEE